MVPRTLLLVLCLLASAVATAAAEPAAPAAKQFLGILRLVERLHADTAWTPADETAVARHFTRLQAAAAERKVIFAGRTLESGERTLGLVVFEAADQKDAEAFMAGDPAVEAGVMTAEVRPYFLAVVQPR